jgi:hypothetical protein
MNIHGFFENQTCEQYLPKKKHRLIGLIAQCEECREYYVLRTNYTALIWRPASGAKEKIK